MRVSCLGSYFTGGYFICCSALAVILRRVFDLLPCLTKCLPFAVQESIEPGAALQWIQDLRVLIQRQIALEEAAKVTDPSVSTNEGAKRNIVFFKIKNNSSVFWFVLDPDGIGRKYQGTRWPADLGYDSPGPAQTDADAAPCLIPASTAFFEEIKEVRRLKVREFECNTVLGRVFVPCLHEPMFLTFCVRHIWAIQTFPS